MSRIAKRRDSGGGEEGGASWMDTYGDLVTLLLCFFVFLFAFSNVDEAKWVEIVGVFTGLQPTIINPLSIGTIMESEVESLNEAEDARQAQMIAENEALLEVPEEFYELYQSIESYIESENLNAEILASLEDRTLTIRFFDQVLFVSGSAVIRDEFISVMDHMLGIFNQNQDLIKMIRIEGHTDDVPISTAIFEDNWDLSAKRASNVLRYLQGSELLPDDKLSCVGYGEFQPIDTNETTEGRARNRRVDFVIESVTDEITMPIE